MQAWQHPGWRLENLPSQMRTHVGAEHAAVIPQAQTAARCVQWQPGNAPKMVVFHRDRLFLDIHIGSNQRVRGGLADVAIEIIEFLAVKVREKPKKSNFPPAGSRFFVSDTNSPNADFQLGKTSIAR